MTMKQSMLNWKEQVKWQLLWPILVRSQTIWQGFTHLTTVLMVWRRKSSLLSLRAILRVKPSQVWMSQKLKQHLIFLWNLTKKKVKLPYQTCLKLMWKTVKKQVFGSLTQLLACLLTSWPLRLETSKEWQLRLRMEPLSESTQQKLTH